MIFLKSIKKVSIIINLTYIVLGYIFISNVNPDNELSYNVLSVGLILSGFFSIMRYFLLNMHLRYKRNDFTLGMILLMLGVSLYIIKLEIFAFLNTIIGMLVILNALFCIQDALDGKAIGLQSIIAYIFIMLLELILGVLILLNPFSNNVLYILMAIALFICGLTSIISNIYLAYRNQIYEKNKKIEDEEDDYLKPEEEEKS